MPKHTLYPETINMTLEKEGSTNNYKFYKANFAPSFIDISILSSRADEIVLPGNNLYKKKRSICFFDEAIGKTLLRIIYNLKKE